MQTLVESAMADTADCEQSGATATTQPINDAEPDDVLKEVESSAAAQTVTLSGTPRSAGAQLLLKAAEQKDKEPSVQINAGFHELLVNALHELFKAQDASCDLKLVSEDGTEQPMHRAVALAMTSGPGSVTADSGGVVKLSGISGTVLSEIVSYMYTGKLGISTETAGDMLRAAQQLGVKGAGELCGKYLNKSISATNALKRYSTAVGFGLTELQEGTLRVIDNDFEQVTVTKDWVELGAADVRAILARDTLSMSCESAAFDALTAWRDHDVSGRMSAYLEMFHDQAVVRLSLLPAKTVTALDSDQKIQSSTKAADAVKAELHRRILGDPPTSKPRMAQASLKTAQSKFCKQKVKKMFQDGNIYSGKIVDVEVEVGTGKLIFRIEYEDGDQEDVYQPEAETLIKAAKTKTKTPTKSPAPKGKSPKAKKAPKSTSSSGPAKKKQKK